MPFHEGGIIAGAGAGTMDIFLPTGDTGPNHKPGAKGPWDSFAQKRLEQSRRSPDRFERHTGGNGPNVLAYLACRSTLNPDVRFLTTLGFNEVSGSIYGDAREHGVTVIPTMDPGCEPAVSIIEQEEGDRMVRGRPRTPLWIDFENEAVQATIDQSEAFVLASLKNHVLTRQLLERLPEGKFLSFAPGGNEFKDGDILRENMEIYPPDLFPANEEELATFFDRSLDDDPRKIAEAMAIEASNKYAKYVLCTLGKHGLLLAHNGDAIWRPATYISPDEIGTTLGAGDRVHAMVLDGLLAARDEGEILEEASVGVLEVIRQTGAHQDLLKAA